MYREQKPCKPARYQLKRHSRYGTSGLAIIFAFEKFPDPNKDRHGTDQEINYLKTFFKHLNLRIYVLKDLTLPQMELALKEIANPGRYHHVLSIPEVKNPRVSTEDSMIFIAITSHGDNTCFELSDGNTMKDVDLEKFFYEDVCSSLVGCPKLYLYNKCRNYEGELRFEMASPIETIETDGLGYSTANSLASLAIPDLNMLVVYTCADGIQSLRIPSSGSLILSALPVHYKEYGSSMEVFEFFTKFLDRMCSCIGDRIERNDQKQLLKNVTQIPSLERITLRYNLYFDSPDPGNRDDELRHKARHSLSGMESTEYPSQFQSTNQHPKTSLQSLLHNPVCGSHDTYNVAYEGWQQQSL